MVRSGTALSRRSLLLAGLWLTAAAAEWAALRPVIFQEHAPPEVVLYHVVGGSFAACGLLAWHRRPESRVGPLMVVTGLLFFVHVTLGRFHSSFAETIGIAVSNYWVITFVALLVWFPGGRRRWVAGERVVIAAFVLAEVVLALAWMLFAEVPRNLALVWPNAHVASVIDKSSSLLGFAASVCLAMLLAGRWLKATRPVRRASAPAAPGALTLLFLGALILQGVFTTAQSPYLVWPTLVGLVLVPAVFLAGVWRAWAARAAVGDLLVDLGSMSGRPLQAALAKALGDPTLTLAYWLPQFGSYADSGGEKLELPADDGNRLLAVVEQDGERVAAIVYDASLAEERKLLDAVVAAAGIALKNERLAAELRARVNELSASRARIVGAGDQERRRLERNLHDGAQQRLVALGMQLRLLGPRIRTDPEAAEALVATAAAELATSVDELRELAHGIHPAVLDHGLSVALQSLAARSTVATAVSVDLLERLPEVVEVAAYFVASEALANVAKHAHASTVQVTVSRDPKGALVEVADDGVGGADDAGGSGLRGLADRVEALGGQLRISSPLGTGTTISAVIPCGS
ncbi:MAG TPA: histidine kinase [Gaiellaceae bacterium]|nr:histidine kinase [Gaiellaceae bacterium]